MTQIFNHNPETQFDAADAYGNIKQLYLSVFHLPSRLEINLKAFITTYNEIFSSQWNEEKVFGRNDPIATFKGTDRRISVAVDIPAFSLGEAKSNLAKCNRIAQFMYPAYLVGNRANTISHPPLVRVCFANLIRRAGSGESPSAEESGLLGFIKQVTITPSFDDSSGFFDPGVGTLYPKLIAVSFDFVPLHEHDLGWGDQIGFNNPEIVNFPFGKTDTEASAFPARDPQRNPDDFVNPQSVEHLQAGPWDPGQLPPGGGVLLDDGSQDGADENAQAAQAQALDAAGLEGPAFVSQGVTLDPEVLPGATGGNTPVGP